ncbi:MAG: hypothetical protein J0L99_03385 [Chitinophagales bacterium]|nr:hypothetical protein [Chitinophagales bacterium]
MRTFLWALSLLSLLGWMACTPRNAGPISGGPRPNQPGPGKPSPVDTVRWTTPPGGKPPIGNPGTGGNNSGKLPGNGASYNIALLLPFVSNSGETVNEKSKPALEFYAGAKVALQQLSEETRINYVVDVLDTKIQDAEFQQVLANPRVAKAQVLIGPIRSSHVTLAAEWAKSRKKILISPETPNAGLVSQFPGFIQINPSLRSHCAAITAYVRRNHGADQVTLICREKERDRLPYFQESNSAYGGGNLRELVLPDATVNFDKIDLKPYFKPGKTSVFILPTWSSQDFVMAFMRKLKTQKGNAKVEVYGMPQWANFESIEPDYLSLLNVHISAGRYVDHSTEEVRAFEQEYYLQTGTIPTPDAYNGYDVMLFCGRQLANYGLAFPEKSAGANWRGIQSRGKMSRVSASANTSADHPEAYDYLENTGVFILRYGLKGYEPAY